MSKTWAEAQSYCREMFTDLATVRNKADNNRLLSVVHGRGKRAWIGLRDDLTKWKWVLGNAGFSNDTDFSNWSSHKLTNNKVMRICAAMSKYGFWYAHTCWQKHAAVCYYGKKDFY